MTDPVDTQAPMRLKTLTRVFYTGNGTVPPGNGLPYVGRIFAVAVTDDLLWYRYGGVGLPEGFDKTWWDPRSGNPIGNGWGNLLHLLGGGDGSVFAVRPDGALLWYQYEGDGTADRSGATGWTASSGNQIGNGWQNFRHLFVSFREGPMTIPATTIFAVAENGDLLWYQYHGNGEVDPSGRTGWHPNSGNAIGNGWGGFQRIVGVGSGVIFGVQPDGALLWYQYQGDGELDRSGASGWHSNSGNQVGNGWQNLNHLFGGFRDGFDDNGGFGFDVYAAAAADGYLRWYRYEGSGEADPSGRAGWHARSGTVIGKGW